MLGTEKEGGMATDETLYRISEGVTISVLQSNGGIVVKLTTMNAGNLVVIPRSGNSVFVTSEKTMEQETRRQDGD